MDIEEIPHLQDVLQPYVENNKKIIEKRLSRLTAPGENFGSTMLKLDLKLQNENGSEEYLHLVAKLLPESELFQKIFNVHVTFKNEMAFYETIVPTLREFQKLKGSKEVVDFFPKFFGARRNLNNSDHVDKNALLLMENLKVQGYIMPDRYKGCNLETCKLVIRNLAKFHAVPIALKLLKPQIFDIKLKPYMLCFSSDSIEIHHHEESKKIILDIVKEVGRFEQIIPKLERSLKMLQKPIKDLFREPYATISHRDLWINNFMIKCENGQPDEIKLLDFQNYSYDSPAKDLLFFLATSAETEILNNNLDDLIKYYHQNFIQSLNDVKCPVNEFSFEEFLNEISASAGQELGHIGFFLLFIVFGKKAVGENGSDNVVRHAKERFFWILDEFDKRRWLNI